MPEANYLVLTKKEFKIMKKNSPVKLKKVTDFSNPAKNEVLTNSSDVYFQITFSRNFRLQKPFSDMKKKKLRNVLKKVTMKQKNNWYRLI